MPSSGSNKQLNNDNAYHDRASVPNSGTGGTDGPDMNNASMDHNRNTAQGPNTAGGTPRNVNNAGQGYPQDTYGTGQGVYGAGMNQDVNMNPYATSRGGAYNQGTYGQYGGAGTGVMPLGAQNPTGGGSITGKVERAIGKVLGGTGLQSEGLQKQQAAQTSNVQGVALDEAQRLERAAMEQRQRAVAHGAHPDNRNLGAGLGGEGGAYGNRPL